MTRRIMIASLLSVWAPVLAQADQVVHDTTAEFAAGAFTDTLDNGSGGSPQLQLVYNLPFGFGDGSDLTYTLSSGTTDAPTDTSVGGTNNSGSMVLNVSTTSGFAAGNVILIHQSRGTNAGYWELNRISSIGTNAFNLENALQYTYTDSGASQAQAIKVRQYSSVTINSGATLTAKAWNQDVGGIVVFMCSGQTNIAGSISAAGCGYNGGSGCSGCSGCILRQAEGTAGASASCSQFANGNGSGGGQNEGSNQLWTTSGGGGNGTAGQNGYSHNGGTTCYGGAAAGNANLSNMVFGGGSGQYMTCGGVRGGGIVFIITRDLVVSGSISVRGQDGCGGNSGGSGGGASGSVLLKVKNPNIGANLVTAPATAGGPSGYGTPGGAGAIGRIHIDYGSGITGSTNPAADTAALQFKTSGTYLSSAINIPGSRSLGSLVWSASGGTSVNFRTRTASTQGGLSAAAWSGYLTSSGSQITSATDEWIQYEATLNGTSSSTPTLTQVTINYSVNAAPSAPTGLQAEGATNPTGVTDTTPEFSAVHTDADSDPASAYEIQVNLAPGFGSTMMWDSGKTAMSPLASGQRSPLIAYAGADLATDGTTYYWRIRFWDDYDAEGPWSTAANFTMASFTPTVPLTMNHQGVVSVNGVRFTGTGLFKFALYSAANGFRWSNDGLQTPSSAVTLPVNNGVYAVALGDTTITNMTEIPTSLFADSDLSLRVWFNDNQGHGQVQLTPDQPLCSAPYAFRADTVSPRAIGSAELANNAVNSFKLGNDPYSLEKVSGGTMISNGGNIGIGTSVPGEKLDVVGGNGRVESGYAWLTTSDVRTKQNISPLQGVLDKLLSVHGVRFDVKGESKTEPAPGRHIGVIAQELEGVFPEIVQTDSNGLKAVDYSKLTPILIEAIREQQNQISAMQQEIDQLRKQLSTKP